MKIPTRTEKLIDTKILENIHKTETCHKIPQRTLNTLKSKNCFLHPQYRWKEVIFCNRKGSKHNFLKERCRISFHESNSRQDWGDGPNHRPEDLPVKQYARSRQVQWKVKRLDVIDCKILILYNFRSVGQCQFQDAFLRNIFIISPGSIVFRKLLNLYVLAIK